MNATASTRAASSPLADLARGCALVLAAFCALEAAMPRAGRTAAGFLLRRDSSILRSLESGGSRVEKLAADGILAGGVAVLVTTAVAAMRARAAARTAACACVIGAAWIFAPAASGDADVWWPVVVCPLVAAAAILSETRRPVALGAVAIQLGVAAHAGWALLLESGSRAVAWLPRASEILVLAGVAVAGLAWGGRRSRLLVVSAAAAFVAACSLAWAYPAAVQAILRHVLGVGAAGLPPVWTAGLAAAALAGLICASRSPAAAAPLAVVLVCARRPEPWFLIGTLASSLLFCQSGWLSPSSPSSPVSISKSE